MFPHQHNNNCHWMPPTSSQICRLQTSTFPMAKRLPSCTHTSCPVTVQILLRWGGLYLDPIGKLSGDRLVSEPSPFHQCRVLLQEGCHLPPCQESDLTAHDTHRGALATRVGVHTTRGPTPTAARQSLTVVGGLAACGPDLTQVLTYRK